MSRVEIMHLRAQNEELIDALNNILKCTPSIRCHGDFANCELLYDCGDPFDLARAAIAKATGAA